MKDFSASDAAIAGFTLARRSPAAILVWSLAQFVVSLAIGAAIVAFVGPDMSKLSGPDAMGAWSDPAMRAQLVGLSLRMQMVLIPIGMCWSAVQSCAIYRAILRPGDGGIGYFRLGGDELRMFGLFLLYLLLFVGAYAGVIIAVLLLAAIGALIASGLDKAAQSGVTAVVVIIAVLAPLVAVSWVLVRLSLSGPMTFAERRIALWRSWALTKGLFWPLSGVYLISAVLACVVMITGYCVALVAGFVITHHGMGELFQATFHPDYASLAALFSPARLVVLATVSLFAGLIAAVWRAPSAEAYRMLTGVGEAPAPPASAPPADAPPPAATGPWG